ncbi:MAG: NADH-quinone oxidoreductase subunit N [Acidobacteria bacterium]|nr:MAG: NADH-quinone oxidoreductase subunit N [Acidobacteriota bacterium]
MNATDLTAILPLLALTVAAVVVMVAICIHRSHQLAVWLTLAGLAAAFVSLWKAASMAPAQVTPLLIIDGYALFYMGLIIAATFVTVILCYGYLEKQQGYSEELYVLILTAALGSSVMVASNHFVSFFLGLEVLSVALYAMSAYLCNRKLPLEAGIKYLVLAAVSAAFLLFGMALIYAQLGTLQFGQIASMLIGGVAYEKTLIYPGLALMITGIGFKLAVVPFHMWTPDVYEGAPAPVTAFVATVSKGGMVALLLRYFYETGAYRLHSVFVVFSIIAIASMIAGNLLALLQNNVKRILAYSSIAHLGYILVAFLAGGNMAAEAVTFYLVAYFVTTLGAFGVVSVLSSGERDADSMEDYESLFWHRPVLAGVFTLMLLSLAGIPLTAGFVGKFFLIASGTSASLYGLIFVLVVTSVVGLFYYLRILVAMYKSPAETGKTAPATLPSLSRSGSFALAALTVLLIWVGVYPGPFLDAIQRAVSTLRIF